MRTSFDTELELPKLQAWFAENPHPSRQQVSKYLFNRELTSLFISRYFVKRVICEIFFSKR